MHQVFSFLLIVLALVSATNILQDQGNGLCQLLSNTNIAALRDKAEFIGWRCEYNSAYGGYLPYEDNRITVCGNRFLDCNSTRAGSSGCSDKFTNTTQIEAWTGIKCDANNPYNIKFLVTHIQLSGRSLTGALPSALGKLAALRVLDMSDNSLSGPIASMITNFASNAHITLESLNLKENSFSSTLPSTIGTITSISSLGLSHNSFSGTIPSQLALLTNLKLVEMESNQFSGTFPEVVFYLPSLTYINLDSNKLTGLPTLQQTCPYLKTVKFSNNLISNNVLQTGNWGNYMPEVQTLHLYNNDLSGTIDATSFGLFHKLQDFEAYNNALTGTLPATVGLLSRLETFHLSQNSLTGTLPPEMSKALNLQIIKLDNNGLLGPWNETVIATLTRLQILHLHSNQISGDIPDSFEKLSSLRELNLQNNLLTGIWPDFSHLVSLQYFDASYNTFSVENRLPTSLLGSVCVNLRSFSCASCNLHGGIPDPLPTPSSPVGTGAFGNMNNFQSLSLQNNFLNGTLPQSMYRSSWLSSIHLEGNAFTGSLPSQLFSNPNDLRYVYVQNNKLTGMIPVSSANPYSCYGGQGCKLRVFNGENNMFSGTLPPQLFSYNLNLQILLLGNNKLSGTIPSSLSRACDVNKLNVIDLSNNLLTGVIPSGLGDLPWYNDALTSVKLNNNFLSGTLPYGLFNQGQLVTLDLSNNAIQAPLDPDTQECLGLDEVISASIDSDSGASVSFTSLQVLRLNNNLLAGNVPLKISLFPNLLTLDLSYNNMTGTIPSAWSALTHLTTLSLAHNSMSGNVPSALIANNGDLITLKLNNNLFSGSLTAVLGTPSNALISNLRTLDVSNNKFVGNLKTLGSSVGVLSSLDVLRVGSQRFDVDSATFDSTDLAWLATSLVRLSPAITELDISGTGLHGTIPTFITTATSLKYLDISNNRLTGTIPQAIDSLDNLQVFDFSLNSFTGTLPQELCTLNAATRVSAFPGNIGILCYLPCLRPLLNGVVTNSANVATCATSKPTGQPTMQPSSQPTRQPTTQPSGQPTTSPTYTYYDGQFAQNVSLVQPRTTPLDRTCSGEIEIRKSQITYAVSNTRIVEELWCIEKRHVDEFRYFGVEQELNTDMVLKNAAGSSPLLDRSKIRSVIFRGKRNEVLVSAGNGQHPAVHANTTLFRSGTCTEIDATTTCSSSFVSYTDLPADIALWEDTLVACPYFSTQKFNIHKVLPVTRAEAWPYGTTAMIQKVRLMHSVSAAIDKSGVTAENIDARVSNLFRSGATSLVGAYLTQKGSSIGGWDRVKLLSAKRVWNETSLTCVNGNGTAGVVTGVVTNLGKDLQFDYEDSLKHAGYISSARLAAIARGDRGFHNVTITHETLGWASVDVTELVREQIHWWYLNTPTKPLELNLLWIPDYASNDRRFYRTHYPRAARGDAWGDFDKVANSTRGRTEWYTSESNDPPVLQLFFQ